MTPSLVCLSLFATFPTEVNRGHVTPVDSNNVALTLTCLFNSKINVKYPKHTPGILCGYFPACSSLQLTSSGLSPPQKKPWSPVTMPPRNCHIEINNIPKCYKLDNPRLAVANLPNFLSFAYAKNISLPKPDLLVSLASLLLIS